MKNNINIGFRGNKIEYSKILSGIETQDTFYQPTPTKTLERGAEKPAEFEFALNA